MVVNVRIPIIEGEGNDARLKPRQGEIYLVEIASRYGKGDAHSVMVPRFGYYEGFSKGAFLFLVPVEGGLNRFSHNDRGETIRRYRVPVNNPPIMEMVESTDKEIPTFKVSGRRVIRSPELEHVKRILDRIGLKPGIEVKFVEE